MGSTHRFHITEVLLTRDVTNLNGRLPPFSQKKETRLHRPAPVPGPTFGEEPLPGPREPGWSHAHHPGLVRVREEGRAADTPAGGDAPLVLPA